MELEMSIFISAYMSGIGFGVWGLVLVNGYQAFDYADLKIDYLFVAKPSAESSVM